MQTKKLFWCFCSSSKYTYLCFGFSRFCDGRERFLLAADMISAGSLMIAHQSYTLCSIKIIETFHYFANRTCTFQNFANDPLLMIGEIAKNLKIILPLVRCKWCGSRATPPLCILLLEHKFGLPAPTINVCPQIPAANTVFLSTYSANISIDHDGGKGHDSWLMASPLFFPFLPSWM